MAASGWSKLWQNRIFRFTCKELCCEKASYRFQHNTVAMVKHSMDVVRKAVQHLYAGQTPVVTLYQPLYAIAKQIQWKWPNKFVVMFGGLHIEMAALRTLGVWLQGSGWVEALVQAEISTASTADSFLRAAYVARTRRTHQVTAAALYILQYRAYNHRDTDTEDEPLGLMNDAQRGKRAALNSSIGQQSCHWSCVYCSAVFLQHVARCSERTCPLVLCSGPYQLCPLDPSSSPRHY